MNAERGFAYCGLACCLCGDETCPGCKTDGCKGAGWCKNYRCSRDKGLSGCYQCEAFPCVGGMLDKLRIRAFSRFLKEYGEEKMLECLARNEAEGMAYHHPGKLTGDYDDVDTEEAVIALILHGRKAADGH